MSYSVVVSNPKSSLNADSLLFHRPSFIKLRHQRLISFSLRKNENAEARISFEIQNNKLISLPFAPFGGVDLNESTTTDLSLLFNEIIEYANRNDLSEIEITSAPDIYNQTTYRKQQENLLELGFGASDLLVQVIEIVQDDFNSLIKSDKNRYLNKCVNFSFKKLPPTFLKPIYDFIKKARDEKGYELSISYSDLEQLAHELPDSVILFGVFDESDRLKASSISVVVSSNILYDFHHDDSLDDRHLGATVTLIKGIYEFCQINNFKLLDLGGSTLNKEINQGLYNYKKSLGAIEAYKTTYKLVI